LLKQKPEKNKFIGYTYLKYIKIYNVDHWISIDKLSMNREYEFKEVGTIIGLLEETNNEVKCKLRKPIVYDAKDLRDVEKGIVCETKNKETLISIAKGLDINIPKMTRSASLCNAIQQKLISMEIKERKKETKYKYFYFWWDIAQHSRKI
jgi:hypothetical protein